ncbi:MAG TPA: ROK family transcriptional regulator [Actinopolymorphaceae bacterium]
MTAPEGVSSESDRRTDERPEPGRPAGPRTARLINDRAAYDLLLERGPLTRAELRVLTGLSRPTVGDLVERLEAQGLLEVVGEAGAERRGPNARLYGVAAGHAHVVGVEVRSSLVLASVTDATARVVGSAALPLDTNAAPDVIVHRAIEAALDDAGLAAERLRAVVVGTPGLVDPATGDVSFVASLPTWHANLLPGLRARLAVPVVLENEVNLAGLAEYRLGAGVGHDTFGLLWLDDGVGLAVLLGGRLHRGASGGAGEVAYIPFTEGATLQSLLGGEAIRGLACEIDGIDEAVAASTGLTDLVAAASDPLLDAIADRVALGAGGICAVLDPGFLVLAGAVGRVGGTALAERVGQRLADLIPLETTVVAAEVEGNPVVRGAVLVALDLVRDEIFSLGSV